MPAASLRSGRAVSRKQSQESAEWLISVAEKRNEALDYFKLDVSKKTLLVLGGSLGARRINQLIAKELDFLFRFLILSTFQEDILLATTMKNCETA